MKNISRRLLLLFAFTLTFLLNIKAQAPDPGNPPAGAPLGISIDGGIFLLFIIGIIYAGKKLYINYRKID